MTILEAIKVLELHNQWRKGADIPQESPVRIGMAINLVVHEMKHHKTEQCTNCGITEVITNGVCNCCGGEQ